MDTVYDVFDIFLSLPDSVSNHFDCMAENSLLTLFTTSLLKVIQVIPVSRCLLLSDISLCHLLDFTPKEIAKTRKLSNLVKLLISKLWSYCTFTCSWDYYLLILMFLWHFSKSLEINITLKRLKNQVEQCCRPSVLRLDVSKAGDVFIHALFFMLISFPADSWFGSSLQRVVVFDWRSSLGRMPPPSYL